MSTMDEIDSMLVAKLFQSESKFGKVRMVKGSFRSIASELNLDEDTIRKRIKALQSAGLLTGWEVHVNPAALGCVMYLLWMDVDPKLLKSDVLKRIRMVHGVLGIIDMVSQTVVIQLVCRTEQSFQRSVNLITEIANGRTIFSYKSQFPASGFRPSPDDWRLIKEVRRRPTSSYYELGRAVGISSRAAKRRLEKLISSRIISIIPGIDLKALKGGIAVDMMVTYSSADLKRGLDAKIASRIGSYAIRVGWGDELHGHFTFAASGIAAARDVSDWVRTLSGATILKLDFMADVVSLPDVYDELIPQE
jgi:DNA-binding Lrp family transcriptional regulator